MDSKRFKRNIEDFVCIKCNLEIRGDGYTNHCPQCLYSLHVDINPGDRKSTCGGIMEPIRVEKEGSETVLVHKCIKCNHVKRNKVNEKDNFDKVVEIAKNLSI